MTPLTVCFFSNSHKIKEPPEKRQESRYRMANLN